MQIVKKHILNIICGVVAIIALVALVWPISGWYSDLQTQAAGAGKVSSDINSLISASRVKPIFSDNAAQGAKGEPLGRFPNKEVIDEANQKMTDVKKQAEMAREAAIEVNRRGHDLLYYAALPAPSDQDAFTFATQYNAVMAPGGKAVPSDPSNPKSVPENIADGILHAAAPPTDKEIMNGLDEEWKKNYAQLIYTTQDPNTGQVQKINEIQIIQKFANEMKSYPDKYRHEIARRAEVYLEPGALTQAPHMNLTAEGGRPPSAESIWYAQMNVWVQQDIARAIAEMNTFRDRADPSRTRPSTGVYESRVKHLKSISLGAGFDMYYTQASAAGAAAPADDTAAAAAPTAQPKVYKDSPTGRACGPMYDVVHSTVTAVVAENAVEDFIRTLQSGRMVTVLNVEKKNLDGALAADQGYDYGPAPVVQVKVQCEHLFMRDWTTRGPKAPMPPEVRKRLGVTDQSQQGAPAGGGNTVASTR
jgi:hypothetical protein